MASTQSAPAQRKATAHKLARETEKEKDVRTSNIVAARAVADAVRTSLGPKGMDKMIISPSNDVIITNDGATILKQLEVMHPCAKMLVDLAHAQDVEAGDGTTTVTVVAGALLGAVQKLLTKGIHPTQIAESFLKAVTKAEEILQNMSIPLDLSDRASLLNSCNTSLSSKVVSQHSNILSPIAVDAVLHVVDPKVATNVDLRDIRVIKKLGGTIEETELINGIVFTQKVSHNAGGPTRVENAKIGLIQFCLSPPKTNMEGNIVINDYQQMDRLLREERNYILNLVNKIKKTGCNVLLIQKSILRDAVNELSLGYLAKLKILVIKDIERDEIEFVSKTLGCTPVASIEAFTADKLGNAKLVEESDTSEGKLVKVTGVAANVKTVSILVRGSNKLLLDEAERSLHDALCVVRSLIKKKFLIAGGAAPEIELALQLSRWAKTLPGAENMCISAYAEAFEIVPYTLAENAGLHPIQIVTELRNKHANGEKNAGISVRKSTIANMMDENVVQPLLVSSSLIRLATETVAMILKIDDIVAVR
jgi:T-complex protein 1 subunit delta